MRCADCNTPISDDRGICDACFDVRLQESIRQDALRVDVEHPSNEYF